MFATHILVVIMSGVHGIFGNCASVYKDEFFQMFLYFSSTKCMFTLNMEYNSSNIGMRVNDILPSDDLLSVSVDPFCSYSLRLTIYKYVIKKDKE